MAIKCNVVTASVSSAIPKDQRVTLCGADGITLTLPVFDDIDVTSNTRFVVVVPAGSGFVAIQMATPDGLLFDANGLTTYTLPSEGQFEFCVNNSRWYGQLVTTSTGGGGTPGLPFGSFQYNSGGVFAGLNGFASDGTNVLVYDSLFTMTDNVDTSKILKFELSGISTLTTRTITMVNFSGTQVLSNGALTSTRIPFSGTAGLQDTSALAWDSVNQQLELSNTGTAAQPSLMIGTSMGWFGTSATNMSLSISGVSRLQCDTASLRSSTTGGFLCLLTDGTAAAPTHSFQDDTNTGMWSTAADTLNFTTGGTSRVTISTTLMTGQSNGSFNMPLAAGSATAPTYSFLNDTNTGVYSDAADTIKWTTGGTQRGTIDSTGRMFVKGTTAPTANVHIAAGTATASTAPLKFVSGALLTTPEDGAHEYLTNLLYFTPGTAVRNIVLTAQQVFSSAAFVKTADTTFATITGLSVTATNTAQYVVEGYLFCSLDATGGGKFQFNGTSTVSFNIQVEFVDNTGDAFTIADRLTTLATPVNTVGPTVGCFRFHGHIRCTGTGTFTVEFAQQVASGASSVDGGSWMRLTQAS